MTTIITKMETCIATEIQIKNEEQICADEECVIASPVNNNNNNNDEDISKHDAGDDSSLFTNGSIDETNSSLNEDVKTYENDEDGIHSKLSTGCSSVYVPTESVAHDPNNSEQNDVTCTTTTTTTTNKHVPKPRLGVKVPYRNLSSQIVSHDEIAQEILERSLQKYSYDIVPEGGDVFFARKLTYRLANKIASNCVDSDAFKNDSTLSSKRIMDELQKMDSSSSCSDNVTGGDLNTVKIENSSDVVSGMDFDIAAAGNNEIDDPLRVEEEEDSSTVSLTPLENMKNPSMLSDDSLLCSSSSKFFATADSHHPTYGSSDLVPTTTTATVTTNNTTIRSLSHLALFKEEKIEAIKNDSKIRAATAAAGSCSSRIKPSIASIMSKSTSINEMDNETLIAILEGTADSSDILPSLVVGKQQSTANNKRKRNAKENGMDPQLEKELALKQLQDFEQAKKKKRSNNNNNNNNNNNSTLESPKRPKRHGEEAASSVTTAIVEKTDDVSAEPTAQNNNDQVPSSTSAIAKRSSKTSYSPKKGGTQQQQQQQQRKTIIPYKFNSVPRRLPKTYHRTIKKQMLNSKRNTNNKVASTNSASADAKRLLETTPKKLPEVPEVQIAIDQYIKTYANKRKSKVIGAQESSSTPASVVSSAAMVVSDEIVNIVVDDNANITTNCPKIDHPHQEAEEVLNVESVKVYGSSSSSSKTALSSRDPRKNEIDPSDGDDKAANSVVNNKLTGKIDANEKPVADSAEELLDIINGVTEQKLDVADKKETTTNEPKRKQTKPLVIKKDHNDISATISGDSNSIISITTTSSKISVNDSPATPAAAKSTPSSSQSNESSRNKHMIREMNRLLGDEGAINMLYAIEQERTTRDSCSDQQSGLPSLRRKKKDLLLKTKLVKNAMMKNAVLPRFGRKKNSPDVSKLSKKTPPVKKPSPKTTPTAASGVIQIPAPPPRKVVAADASKIIRRHSSSSSSSDDEHITGILNAAIVAAATTKASMSTPPTATRTSERQAAERRSESVFGASNQSTSTIIMHDDVNNSEVFSTPVTQMTAKSLNAASTEKRGDDAKSCTTAVETSTNKNKTKSETKGGASKRIQSSRLTTEHAKAGPSKVLNDSSDDVIINRYNDTMLVKVILTSSSAKMKNAWNTLLLRELIKTLNNLENDPSCHVVLVTSTGSYFCQGIDVSTLICNDPTERRKIVDEFVNLLGDFIKCLANFPKPLIAGVSGAAVGLGVTILPFFDIIFASDKATFCTPYAKLGHAPEGAATLTLPAVLGSAVANELLFACRMLTATEALQFGLITRILWPDKFNDELLTLSKSIAEKSLQSVKATKQLLRQDMRSKLDSVLKAERLHLIEHWCSDECQSNFERYVNEEAVCTFC